MDIIVHGTGTMGAQLAKMIEDTEGFHLTGFADELADERGDLIIDFSHHSRIDSLVDFATDKKIPLLIATTGYSPDSLEKIKKAGKEIPILLSSNTSIGINTMNSILEKIVPYLYENFDIEVIEKHHNKKLDSPSGTAKTLVETIVGASVDMEKKYGRFGNAKREKNEIGIHALRGGTIPGEHTVLFCGEDEIIEIKHTALSKKIFAKGALEAGKILVKKPVGFYTMKDIYGGK